MTQISKFYLLDAASPNGGILPSDNPGASAFTITGVAPGATTNRDASDTPGTANPDTESVVTANADQTLQTWSHRRFLSRPLAAQLVPLNVSGGWTFSYARYESNTSHNQSIWFGVSVWRPETGTLQASGVSGFGTEGTTSESPESITNTNSAAAYPCNPGDILVFEIVTQFTQSMSTAYTDTFAYNGTTEASSTTCATFISPPSPLTLLYPIEPAKHPAFIYLRKNR